MDKVKVRETESVAQVGTWVVEKTESGFNKKKVFCERCGCTLWTIPMQHGGQKVVVRTALLENGYVTIEVWPTRLFFTLLTRTPIFS